MSLHQLNPTIPLRSEKASGEAIAVIDYSIEHDLMWVIVDDASGQIWTVPNRDVRAYENYSAGRNFQKDDYLQRFAQNYLANPTEAKQTLDACLSPDHILSAVKTISQWSSTHG